MKLFEFDLDKSVREYGRLMSVPPWYFKDCNEAEITAWRSAVAKKGWKTRRDRSKIDEALK